MKKIKFLKPYQDGNTKTNLMFTKNKSGVYIICKIGSDTPVYIGMSTNDLYTTCLRHFQSWQDPKQIRVTYPKQGYKIRIVLCTKLQAIKLERALIVKHKPKDNPNKYLNYTLELTDKKIIEQYIDESQGDAPF